MKAFLYRQFNADKTTTNFYSKYQLETHVFVVSARRESHDTTDVKVLLSYNKINSLLSNGIRATLECVYVCISSVWYVNMY